MAGRTRKFNPVLSEQDKATLEKIVSSRTEEIRKVQRAKMILLAASGSSNTDIANNLGISRPVVNKIIKTLFFSRSPGSLRRCSTPRASERTGSGAADMDYFFGLQQAKRTS